MELQHKAYHLFFASKISFINSMTAIDSTNDQNTMRSYLRLHLHINNQNTHQRKTWNYSIFIVIIKRFSKFGHYGLGFIRKVMYNLVNVENY